MIRKNIAMGLSILVVAFLFGTALPGFAGVLEDVKAKGVLVVSTDANYAPQSFLNEKGELDGFDIDVAKEVAKRLGVGVEFVTPDWDLIVSGKWGGRWDVSIGSMTITKERSAVVDFSIPYYYTPAQFAIHNKNKGIKTIDGLVGKTVGVGAGTTYDSYLDPGQSLTIGGGEKIVRVTGINGKPYSTDMEAVQDLALGDGVRLDGVLTSGFVVQEAMKKGVPITPLGNPVYYEPLAAASDKARPGSSQFVQKISEVFESMHKDGTLTRLSEKWYGFDVTKKAM